MKGPSNIAPSDIEDFQKAAGTVLAQLYDNFPMAISIDRVAIARALARTEDVLNAKLPSGMPFDEFLSNTIVWLQEEASSAIRAPLLGIWFRFQVKACSR